MRVRVACTPEHLTSLFKDEPWRVSVHKNVGSFWDTWGHADLFAGDIVECTKVWTVKDPDDPESPVVLYRVRGMNKDGKHVKGWVNASLMEPIE